MKLRLAQIAHARSGDKADTADIGLFAWDPTGYAVLAEHVTAEKVERHFAHLWPETVAMTNPAPRVERFDLPQLLALKFVLRGALNGGAASSLRSDNLGKTIAAQLLRMEIELPQAQADAVLQAAQTAIDQF
ncbi:MAG: AtuA-related protein [Limnohabitans sp.]